MPFWHRIVIAAVVLLVVTLVGRLVDWWLARRSVPPEIETRYRVLRRAVSVTIIAVGLFSALLVIPQVRAVAGGLLASSAILGVIIGLASQQTLGNFIAGLLIATTQPVRIGDRVSYAGESGVVEEIGLTYTFIRTVDRRRLVVPNSKLASDTIVNASIRSSETFAEVSVPVPLSADLGAAVDALREDVAEERDASVYVSALDGSATVTLRAAASETGGRAPRAEPPAARAPAPPDARRLDVSRKRKSPKRRPPRRRRRLILVLAIVVLLVALAVTAAGGAVYLARAQPERAATRAAGRQLAGLRRQRQPDRRPAGRREQDGSPPCCDQPVDAQGHGRDRGQTLLPARRRRPGRDPPGTGDRCSAPDTSSREDRPSRRSWCETSTSRPSRPCSGRSSRRASPSSSRMRGRETGSSRPTSTTSTTGTTRTGSRPRPRRTSPFRRVG